MRYQHLFKYSLAALLAFSFPACSDDSGSSEGEQEEQEVPETPETPETPEVPDDPEVPYDPEIPEEEPEEGWHSILVPAMATDVEVANASNVRLQVMLVSLQGENAGDGLVGEDVKWGIETGVSSVKLTTGKTTTGEGGLTNVNVKATEIAGDAVIVASNAESPKAVKFNVTVLEKPTGNISASVSYSGPAPAENYSIRLYDGDAVECANVDLENGSIIDLNTDTEAEPLFPASDGKYAKFEKLSTDMRYTLIAYGYAENGAPVAAGCLDSGTKVRPDETTSVTIHLDTIDLDPVTSYDVRSFFDLGDVVASLGTVGYYIDQVNQFARNPAQKVYDILFKLIKEELGAGFIATVVDKVLELTSLKSQLLSKLNGYVTQSAMACKMGLFACQFNNVVTQMELLGHLDIQKEGSIELSGKNAYNGLAVYWRMKCAGDSDPNCGRHPITTTSLTSSPAGADINLLEGSWVGALSNGYDKISIESHSLIFSYGKVAMILINDFLLPRITENKCHDMTCALGYWINADALAQWLSDTLTMEIDLWFKTYTIDVSKDKAKGWVDSAVSGIGKLLGLGSAMLELQSADSNITISGTAHLKDTNADNVVDIIYDGNWSGNMEIKSNQDGVETVTATAVRGIWSAYNNKNVSDGEGMYCTEYKTETDSKDQLCHYPNIDLEGFSSSGMCAAYAKCAN